MITAGGTERQSSWVRRCSEHEVDFASSGECPECSRLLLDRQSEGVTVFDGGDDEGYRAWVSKHRGGYVLNMEKSYNPNYVILHQATCHTINGEPARGDVFVGDYVKACARRRSELEDWTIKNVGTSPSRCEVCF
ncbi:hypothetical protein [Mycobacterium sp. shizuoka-1]|uniref:hypothetical protein n=1 Tax=Mycobacterium sp. shizuoka-1 TaxID=2039281 RepID=UPI000C063216|nr:hypothetical protein [Mycobacterium sp. shizuoka-1]GAY18742.1 hypothetical protein MSZK_54680 [Mycobacterium sp. shizuoka-1]